MTMTMTVVHIAMNVVDEHFHRMIGSALTGRRDLMPDNFEFDTWLLDQMERKNMNHDQLAQRAGIRSSNITYYLYYGKLPTLRTFLKILDALGMTVQFADR